MNAAATKLPTEIGPIHFVGIGGIGMSGIAEVLLNHGYTVQGSDLKASKITDRLQELGATIFVGQKAENLKDAEVVVISSAIKPGNPELDQARHVGLPVVRRAEMLAELMRLKSNVAVGGTHGKTTTTTMVATLLDAGALDPTVINGGIIHAYGSNARMGQGEWMVVEADESDGTFNRLPATIAIVTNIDPEHLDFYGDFENAKMAFETFVKNVPFYGFSVMCIDHPEVQALIGKIIDRRVVTYGFSLQAEVRGTNVSFNEGSAHFDVEISNRKDDSVIVLENITMPMPGRHNISNALAAIAVSYELGISPDVIRRTFSRFSGVKRRFTLVDKVDGITIVDDYAHHPVEIASVLSAAREAYNGRVIAVMQPHRYTRLESLFEEFCGCFNNADTVIVTPVFEAGEQPIEGADQDALISGLQRFGHRGVVKVTGPDELPSTISDIAEDGDLVIYLGAGSVSSWAYALPDALREERAK